MSHPFIMLDFPVSGSANIDLADMEPLFQSIAEAGAQAHWLLGDDNPDHKDLISEQTLAAIGAAPSLHDGFLTTAGGVSDGLSTMIDDARDQTLVAVFKRVPPANYAMVMGCASGDHNQCSVFVLSTGYIAQTIVGGDNIDNPLALPADSADGDWLFVAMAHSQTERRVFVGGAVPTVGTRNVVKDVTGGKAALGSNHPLTNTPMSFAEFMVFDRALALPEMAAVYRRSKTRLADRAVAVI